ncbi:MAG: SEC-C metal-binding domain-containing protein [Acidobacteriota bacterium]|nr:SEC-C metal-binding domain-containing protein [Acidobacteriota bacterium]
MAKKTGRNDPCPCGSGQKYKNCCLKSGGVEGSQRTKIAGILALVVVVAVVILWFAVGRTPAALTGAVGAVIVGAYWLLSDPPPPRTGGNPGAINFGN